ncbi:hypothetical protein SAY87_005472 [Trapa incisa]|uniref:Uncharacterized protein n=1 Tax=Trapa incisa TaxID=236973 RepID=A0AAN7Q7P1_9MYRT|nr:hypothetical protein SAY87_005472 [Trapa incisa]
MLHCTGGCSNLPLRRTNLLVFAQKKTKKTRKKSAGVLTSLSAMFCWCSIQIILKEDVESAPGKEGEVDKRIVFLPEIREINARACGGAEAPPP